MHLINHFGVILIFVKIYQNYIYRNFSQEMPKINPVSFMNESITEVRKRNYYLTAIRKQKHIKRGKLEKGNLFYLYRG